MQTPNIIKSFPLHGATLGQSWIYETDIGILAQYSYQDLIINLHEFNHNQALKNYLLERGVIHSVVLECLTCYTSFRQASSSISDRIPQGVDQVKLGLQDPTAFKPLILTTVVNLLNRVNTQLTTDQPLIQSEEMNELLKTLLHYDTVTTQLEKVNPILDDLNQSIDSNNIENSSNIID